MIASYKIMSLQRCVSRAREELTTAGSDFSTNFTAQDAAILNALRACELTIDLANMLIRARRLGIPAQSRESFSILVRENFLSPELGTRLQRMVGFRNVAVHQYRELDVAIVESVIRDGLTDLLEFAEMIRMHLKQED